jgi:hypothetical protein
MIGQVTIKCQGSILDVRTVDGTSALDICNYVEAKVNPANSKGIRKFVYCYEVIITTQATEVIDNV